MTNEKPGLTPTIPQVLGEIYDPGLRDRGLDVFPKEGGRDGSVALSIHNM